MEILGLEEKLLIDKTIEILSDEERIEQIRKTKKFKRSNRRGWNDGNFNQIRCVGALILFIGDFGPRTVIEFARMYFEHGAKGTCRTTNKGKPQRVSRTAKELKELSLKFKERYNRINIDDSPMTEEEAFEFVVIRVFYETFSGGKREKNAKIALNKYLKENFNKQYKTQDKANNIDVEPDVLDRNYAIDCLIIDRNKNAVIGIQIKPESWIGLKPNKYCPETYENYEKMSKFKEEFNVEAMFLYAKENGEIIGGLDELASYLHSIC